MIREFLAAIAFLTRFPVLPDRPFNAREVARSARWFPLVGLAIGFALLSTARATALLFPALVAALIVVVVHMALTGALHMDGLADMADGFGGGHSKENVLRIMRDHAIGTYGAVALILAVGVKAACIAAFIESSRRPEHYLVLAPTLGRWSAVLMSVLQPYARSDMEAGISALIGRSELMVATVLTVTASTLLSGWSGLVVVLVATAVTIAVSVYCRYRIGGITGDTIGGNCQIVEVVTLLIGVAAVRS